jgi:hypothetical protein
VRRSFGLGREKIVVGLVILSVLLVGSLWVVPYLPTNDGPEWVFASHIENHYSDPATPYYRDAYVPALQFASRGFTVLYGPLEAWLGWQRGLQVALSVVVLVVAWSLVALVRALDPRRLALGFLAFPLALSWTFYMGFWAFALATGCGFLVLALAVRRLGRGELPVPARVVVSLLLLLTAVAHIFAAVVAGVALTFLLVASAPRGRRLLELGKAGVMGLPAASIAAASVAVAGHAATRVAFAHETSWFSWREVIALLPQTLWPGPMGRALVAVAAVAAAGVVACVRARQSETSGVDRGLGLAGVVLLLATIFAPVNVPGWQCLSQRFATAGVALAVVVLPLERLRARGQSIAAGALFAAALASVGLSYPMHRRLAALCPDAVAGLAAPVHRVGVQLPVALAPAEGGRTERLRGEVPMMNPLLHMGALYAAAQGGLIPYVYASSAATHPFTLRPNDARQPVPNIEYYWKALRSEPFRTDPGFRREIEEDLASYGMLYEGVVLVGARPGDTELWQARGYVADWARGATFVGHFEPCGLDFTAPASAAKPGPSFDVGWGRFEPIENARAPATVGPDGLAHFTLDSTPCGDLHVRARWEPATPGGAPRVCSNADRDGYLRASITRTARHVACTDLVAGEDPSAVAGPVRAE